MSGDGARQNQTYPSGLTGPLPMPDESASWPALLDLAIDEQPLGMRAPCLNPECGGDVVFDPGSPGPPARYCSHYCRSRASDLRQRAIQQLQVIEAALGEQGRYVRGVPRAELRDRARHLKWWLARIPRQD